MREALEGLGFICLEADPGVFVKVVDSEILILAMHVDDCLLTGNSNDLMKEFKVEINRKYKITDQGECSWLLGIKIE